MTSKEKSALTNINKIPLFKQTIKKLTIDGDLTEEEKTYILTCAILFLKQYQADNRLTSYAELAYYIILKYSISYEDYKPLYDFSASFGFYPIVNAIWNNKLIDGHSLGDCILSIEIERFKSENYIETFHQYKKKQNLLDDEISELSFIAPTSFGKSSVIVDYIRKYDGLTKKVGIIVPTKSLLMQTYRMIREVAVNKKLIIHDEMYQNENEFIAIFTQERALRLLRKFSVHFDLLFIDEAHNVFKDDPRSILLTRLIAKNRELNPAQRIVYLSPLIEKTKNLKVRAEQEINEHRIPFNIKEPELNEYRINNEVVKYNRFVNEFYHTGTEPDVFTYITSREKKKNFVYINSPIKIANFSKELAERLPDVPLTNAMTSLISVLKQEIHERFYAIEYIRYGVIYLHGKLPNLIKEYLESKFRDLAGIKYVVANKVILEGMNLPIDNLYILNTYKLSGQELTNLIGRVNRLNSIFISGENNLPKLLPPVHFVNNDEYNRQNSNMASKITLLRSHTFADKVENPTLSEFNFENLNIAANQREQKREKYEKICEHERFLNSIATDEKDRIKKYLIENDISIYYSDLDILAGLLNRRIKDFSVDIQWSEKNIMEKIYELFIKDINTITDFEFSRLDHPAARKYYYSYITVSQKQALKDNIVRQYEYFKRRIEQSNSIFYIGQTFGERARDLNALPLGATTYVDLALKTDTELVNLAIVKLKLEDDFVSFKLNKFIIMIYDFGLLTTEEYNLYTYGTTDENKIELTKMGLSISLISRLDADNQLQYLYFDNSNNLRSRPEFEQYKANINDFYRFEIERFV